MAFSSSRIGTSMRPSPLASPTPLAARPSMASFQVASAKKWGEFRSAHVSHQAPAPATTVARTDTALRAYAVDDLPAASELPKLVVFDLDNTLWTPELYQLRKLPGYANAELPGPVANKDVRLFKGAEEALAEIANSERWKGTKVAVASRTNKGPWAKSLLTQFQVEGAGTLADLVDCEQIYTGTKVQHLTSIQNATGIAFEDMLFFDDARGGKYGNCVPVAEMGVMSAHCPNGLTAEVWSNALKHFALAKADGGRMGVVVDDPSQQRAAHTVLEGELEASNATVKMYADDRGFGFVRMPKQAGIAQDDVFFHRRALAPGFEVVKGSRVDVTVAPDPKTPGRLACTSVRPSGRASSSGRPSDGAAVGAVSASAGDGGGETVTLPTFSMNMPFAGLVAHGVKTLETRNGAMLTGLDGATVLLHVGRRTFPDGGAHAEILRRPGGAADEAELRRVTSLPAGFARGEIVAVLELGETVLMEDVNDRSAPEIEMGAVATGAAMGRYLTTVKKATWLEPPGLKMPGRPGVWDVDIPISMLPADAIPAELQTANVLA